MVLRGVILTLLLLAVSATSGFAEDQPLETRLQAIINSAVDSGATGRACAMGLAQWVNANLEYVPTDYKQRTVGEILDREAGNCAEMGRVLLALIKEAGLQSRWVADINIQPDSESRRESAEAKIAEKGLKMSVFGYMHNDHRWLEIYDEATKEWFPADPTQFLVGLDDWVRHRVGFDERKEGGEDMIVPIVIAVREKKEPFVDRSEYYLIDQFDRVYGGKLSSLPGWEKWTGLVKKLSAHGLAALEGKENLHEYVELMKEYKAAYLDLKEQYLAME